MEATIVFPRGLTELVEFKRLRVNVGGTHAAVACVWHLFAHLANSVQVGELGRLPQGDIPLLQAELAHKAQFEALVEARWLVPGDDGVLTCPHFARLNRHLDPGFKDNATRGGDLKRFNGAVRRGEKLVGQLALLPEQTWAVPEGDGARSLDSEEIRQVCVLVSAADGALGRASRATHEGDWPLDLVNAAWRVISKHGLTQALKVLEEIVRLGFDRSPATPRTTELALLRFELLVDMVRAHPDGRL